MATCILTLVRHGESTDNLTALWAGHRDAPLSNHGFAQAQALGKHFKDVPITAIYTSDLKRARTTAQSIYDHSTQPTKPPFTVSTLLREQYFGAAEGEPWDAGKYNSTHLPWDDHRAFELAPEAESLNDVSHRADLALRHFIAPHAIASAQAGAEPSHIVLVAHGIFLSEMLFALHRAQNPNARFVKSGGYTNTGWSRIEITPLLGDDAPPARDSVPAPPGTFKSPPDASAPVLAGSNPEAPYKSLDAVPIPPRHAELPPPLSPGDSVPALKIEVVAMNQTEHLNGLVRQKGGIGNAEHDARQKKMTEFLSGKTSLEEWKGKV
ncbi:phosphoglycerate mutase-like protein [Meredithblackwellia eburnea MCA 4105]